VFDVTSKDDRSQKVWGHKGMRLGMGAPITTKKKLTFWLVFFSMSYVLEQKRFA